MLKPPLFRKGLECLRCKLWSLVRPYDVRYPITTKDTKQITSEMSSCRVRTHVDDLWPVSTTVNNDEKLVYPLGAKTSCNFLE